MGRAEDAVKNFLGLLGRGAFLLVPPIFPVIPSGARLKAVFVGRNTPSQKAVSVSPSKCCHCAFSTVILELPLERRLPRISS